jgi:hypothetical protein
VTVRELIEQLQDMPPGDEVRYDAFPAVSDSPITEVYHVSEYDQNYVAVA